MTNAEKYEEVFGLPVDPSMCPTINCDLCDCVRKDTEGSVSCIAACTYAWWNEEYHEVKKE